MKSLVVASLLVVLVLPVTPLASAQAADGPWVELRRWDEGSGLHTNLVFELEPDEVFTDYFFKVNPPGDGLTDVGVAILRVRVVSTAIPVCAGFAVDTGETNDKLQKCDDLRTQHSYNLDYWVQSPGVTLSLYGQNNPL